MFGTAGSFRPWSQGWWCRRSPDKQRLDDAYAVTRVCSAGTAFSMEAYSLGHRLRLFMSWRSLGCFVWLVGTLEVCMGLGPYRLPRSLAMNAPTIALHHELQRADGTETLRAHSFLSTTEGQQNPWTAISTYSDFLRRFNIPEVHGEPRVFSFARGVRKYFRSCTENCVSATGSYHAVCHLGACPW